MTADPVRAGEEDGTWLLWRSQLLAGAQRDALTGDTEPDGKNKQTESPGQFINSRGFGQRFVNFTYVTVRRCGGKLSNQPNQGPQASSVAYCDVTLSKALSISGPWS